MKTMVLLYDTSCIYEIVILNYFLKVTGKEMIFVSPEGNPAFFDSVGVGSYPIDLHITTVT